MTRVFRCLLVVAMIPLRKVLLARFVGRLFLYSVEKTKAVSFLPTQEALEMSEMRSAEVAFDGMPMSTELFPPNVRDRNCHELQE